MSGHVAGVVEDLTATAAEQLGPRATRYSVLFTAARNAGMVRDYWAGRGELARASLYRQSARILTRSAIQAARANAHG